MSDVRKEGPHFRTLRRIYRVKENGARVLLFAAGKLLRQADVENFDLEVEPEKKAPTTKARKPGENK